MSSIGKNIELGILESAEPWRLESRFFPCKVGGKPAWLDLSTNIPNFSNLKCSKCEKTLIFMCQIYAPIETNENCFHRTLFLFFCRNEKCCVSNSNQNMKIFRSQLNRNNAYYPYEPPIEEETWRTDLTTELFGVHLCEVCGIRSNSHCAKCKSVYYCCRQHQIVDWKSGHKFNCNAKAMRNQSDPNEFRDNNGKSLMFPEFELVTEIEGLDYVENSTTAESQDLEMQKFIKLTEDGKAGTLQDVHLIEDELSKFAFKDEDEIFTKFEKRIKHFPNQVLRYDRGGKPLWITASYQADEQDIPSCQYCKGRRIFEFQILPQLLNYLELDTTESSIDWGVLAIYTCENSCNSDPAYKEEFIWKQDISSSQ